MMLQLRKRNHAVSTDVVGRKVWRFFPEQEYLREWRPIVLECKNPLNVEILTKDVVED